MFVRVITVLLKPETLDEAASIYQNRVVPTAQAQKGCRSASFLLNRASGKGCSVAFWETEEDMKAGETSPYLREQIAKMAPMFASQPVVEDYEVVAHGEFVRA